MAKRGRTKKTDNGNPKRASRRDYIDPEDMDDDIDTFHKQRDVIPLDINDDDAESSDEEEELVLDFQGFDDDDNDVSDEDGDDDDDDDDEDDDTQLTAKIKRQQKYLREKFGAPNDELYDSDEANEEDGKDVWGGKKHQYYGGGDYEGESSDSDVLKDEEVVLNEMQRKKADALSMEDFGLDNIGDRELSMEEISVKGKRKTNDLDGLSGKEPMDAVDSSAPELVGLLSELNDALEQLETKVNPLLEKVKMGGIILEGGLRYLEVKQLLLLAYCQAITFYLLLKSEGQPILDHPVIARLVEIKELLEKMKQLDGNIPSEVEEFLKKNDRADRRESKVTENVASAFLSESVTKDHTSVHASAEAGVKESEEPSGSSELAKVASLKNHEIKEKKKKNKTDQVGLQSVEMLKVRAKLEEKLKQKGFYDSIAPKFDKVQKHKKSVNRQLETYDDFNDDAVDVEKGNHGFSNGHVNLLGSSKLSKLVSAKPNKPKTVSGDDDLPKRDDIGERRRKHEIRVLASAGVRSEDDALHEPDQLEPDDLSGDPSDMEEDGDTESSEDEFYEETKQKRDTKFAAKAEKYARKPAVAALPETVDGKRQITRQIEKNTGLTRHRRKDLKNPRKKYRTKHDKQKKRWKGQVPQTRRPAGSYGGEATGINVGVSRSIRF